MHADGKRPQKTNDIMPNMNNWRAVEAFEALTEAGIDISYEDDSKLEFWHNHHMVTYYIKKQWATGKSIQDGRGLKNLIKQLTA